MTVAEELTFLVGTPPEDWEQWPRVRLNAYLRGAHTFQTGNPAYDVLGHSASPYASKAGSLTMWWHMGWTDAQQYKEEA